VVKHLPGKFKALSSNISAAKKHMLMPGKLHANNKTSYFYSTHFPRTITSFSGALVTIC
jgi:hypothetical protein